MEFYKLLTSESVILPLVASTKEDAIGKLISCFVKVHQITDPNKLIWELKEREELCTTFLPSGLAVPHARSELVNDIKAVMGIVPQGIKDVRSCSERIARVFCLFFAPMKEGSFGEHLKFLSHLSAIFGEPGMVEEISKMNKIEDIIARIALREKDLED